MASTHQKLEQGARSREALLAAAIELIAEGGYNATGVDAIARRSGVVKSALYWHFGSKDGLLIAALERTAADWVRAVENAVVEEAVDPVTRLDRLIEGVYEIYTQRPERIRLIMSALLERGATNEDVRNGVRRIFDLMRESLARGLMLALPAVEEERVRGLSALVLETLGGAFIDVCADPDLGHFEERLKWVRRMVLLTTAHELQVAQRPKSAGRGRSSTK